MGTFCGLQLPTAQQRGSAPSRLKPTICAFCSGTSHHAPWQLSTSWAVARRQGGHPAPILSSECRRDAEERNRSRIFDECSLKFHLVAHGGRDGAALVGALLEELARRGGPTIFGAPPCRSTPHHYCLLFR